MVDRSVVVRLRAEISQYQAGMAQAKQSTVEFGRELTGTGKTSSASLERVGRTALVAGGVMAVGFAKGLSVAAGFEKQMSSVKAVSGASADEMGRLSKAAIAAGADVKLAGVTASDAARAEAELVKAGVSVSDVLGGALKGALTLAAAGQIDFADAATIAAQAMNIFDLKGGAVAHVADVLAAAANKSAADVGSLGDGLRQGGLVASQYGLTLEDTVGTLAAFADNALVGSDAGTSLKTMLQRLSPTSKESAALMEKLGFSAYDVQGNFVGIAGVADELQTALAGMTQQQRDTTLATLFGSDAVRGANVLYEQGATGINDYVKAVNDQGAAARMAAIQNDNLSGDIEALGGAIESAFITNGSKANSELRGLTQEATGLVAGFSAMPSEVQTTAVAVGGLVAAGTLAVGVIGTMAPKALAAQDALSGMGNSGAFLARNLGTVASSLGVLGAGFTVFSMWEAMMAKAKAAGEDAAATWESLAFAQDGVKDGKKGLEGFREEMEIVFREADKLGRQANSGSAPWDADHRAEMLAAEHALRGTGAEMSQVERLAVDLAKQFGVSEEATFNFVMAQRNAGVDVAVPKYHDLRDSMAEAFSQMPRGAANTEQVTSSLADNAVAAKSADDAFKDLQSTYRASVDPLFAMLDAMDKNKDALAAQGEAAAEGAKNVTAAAKDVTDAETALNTARGTPDNADGIAAAEDRLTAARSRLSDVQADAAITTQELSGMNRDAAASALDLELAAQNLANEIQKNPALLDAASQKLYEWVAAGVITADQAKELQKQFERAAGKADALAGDYVVNFKGNTDDVVKKILGLNDLIAVVAYRGAASGVDVSNQIRHLLYDQEASHASHGGPVRHLAVGGFPGSPQGSDTIPAWLTEGEYVINAPAAARFGVRNLDAINSGHTVPSTAGGSWSTDNSRHVRFDAPMTVVAPSPQSAAGQVNFRLKRVALELVG